MAYVAQHELMDVAAHELDLLVVGQHHVEELQRVVEEQRVGRVDFLYVDAAQH
jgi:hypothetical protein